jgi:CO/xanthine dehydrogenase Mo-binding subunit
MEGRDCVASWDAGLGIMTVYAATQSAHVSRIGVGACMDIEGDKVHVLARDIGGSFGLKIRASREELAVTAASRHLGRPVHGTMINRDKGPSGAGGARTHDRRIMRSLARRSGRAACTDTTESRRWWR